MHVDPGATTRRSCQSPSASSSESAPGTAAIARRFAAEDHLVALVARSKDFAPALAVSIGASARSYEADASDPGALERTFSSIGQDLGEVDVLVYNAGSGVWGTVEEITTDAFQAAWRVTPSERSSHRSRSSRR
jgi:NAD(P)-dependent dehydrogenase (short-subunit alcohol dehydrogenase family)